MAIGTFKRALDAILPDSVYTGVVQAAFPSMGLIFVNAAAGNQVTRTIMCRLPGVGGVIGGSVINPPPAGTTVSIRRERQTDYGYVVSVNPQGCEQAVAANAIRLRNNPDVPPVSSLKFVRQLITESITQSGLRGQSGYFGGLEDQYPGDIVIGDRYGPQIFYGRTALQITGSQMSYAEFSAVDDKLTILTVEAQLDTFSDKCTYTTDLNKRLKAASLQQGLGGRHWDQDLKFIQEDADKTLDYSAVIKDPLFRQQEFNGGAVRGNYKTLITALKDKPEQTPPLVSQITTYDGSQLKMSVQGNTSIKTPFVAGLVQRPFPQELTTQELQDYKEDRKQEIEKTVQKFVSQELSDHGWQRILQLQALIQKDSRQLVYNMLGADATQKLIEKQVDPLSQLYGNCVQWDGANEPQIGQFIGDSKDTTTTDDFTKLQTKRFNNTSIITQDPDGTITLKDGWGSQITMSRGNIYISSALDTFIRPGRDLIALVPEHISMTANRQMQLAAKKNIKIAAQKNLSLASAINGGDGYTVLQNRSQKKSINNGMVIRSNGYLTVTSSDDMHIGINDKRTQNKTSAANQGLGSIFIEGQKVRIESRGELRLLGTSTGIFACSSQGGTGIMLSTNQVVAVAPSMSIDSSNVRLGSFQSSYTIKTGATGSQTVTLSKGDGSAIVHLRGALQCRDITCAGSVYMSGMCVGDAFMVWKTQKQEDIPGTKQASINSFHASIRKIFNSPLTASGLSFVSNLQPWYNDDYICQKELSFMDTWRNTKLPAMCWQLQESTNKFDLLQGVWAITTGKDTLTASFPGKNGWDGNTKIITVTKDGIIDQEQTIQQAYTTYTEKEK